jgi:hypothetical protein
MNGRGHRKRNQSPTPAREAARPVTYQRPNDQSLHSSKEAISSQRKASAVSALACPVPDCKTKSAAGFSAKNKRTRHIRTVHPNFDYAYSQPSARQIAPPLGHPRLTNSAQKTRDYNCPIVGCDTNASFSPRVKLFQTCHGKASRYRPRRSARHHNSKQMCRESYSLPNSKGRFHSEDRVQVQQSHICLCSPYLLRDICDRETFQRNVRCAHPASDHARVLESTLHNNPLILSPMPSPRKFEADQHRAVKHNAQPNAFGYREPEFWSSIQEHAKNRIANARMIHGGYGLLTPKPCTHCQKRRIACLVYHPEVCGVEREVTGYCGECKNRGGLKCDVERFAFPEYQLLMDDYIPSVIRQSKGGSVTPEENDSIAVEQPMARLRSVEVGNGDDTDGSIANDHEISNLHIVDFGSEPSSNSGECSGGAEHDETYVQHEQPRISSSPPPLESFLIMTRADRIWMEVLHAKARRTSS